MLIAVLPGELRRLAFLLLCVIAPLALADSGVWGERGIVRRLAVRGPLLFAADGRGVSIYDVSTNAPRNVGVVPTADESLDVAVRDDLYVLTRGEILRFGIAANGALTQLASIPTRDYSMIAAGDGLIAAAGASRLTLWTATGEAYAELAPPGVINAIVFHGSELWIAVQGQAIYGYDLARGVQPVGTIPVSAYGIAVRGDMLFAAAGASGLVIADVSDVANPRIVSRTGEGEVDLSAIAVGSDRAYASEGVSTIRVFDVSDVGAPSQLAPIGDHAQALAADGARLFAGGTDVDSFGLIHATPLRFSIYDDDVRAGGFTDSAGGPVSGVATDGTFAYVADWPDFRVLDISTPSQPKQLASITFPDMQDFVKIRGNLAIVYGRAKLNLIDIHDPWHPRFLGTFDSLGIAGGGAAFSGDAIIEANPTTGMHFLDFFRLTTPDHPVQIGGVKNHYYEAVSLYPAVYGFDLTTMRIIDASDSTHPKILNEVLVPRGPATIAGNYLVVESPDRFRVFDVSDPLKPVEVGTAAPAATSGPLAADGDGVLVARAGEIDRLDISNPFHPELTKSGMTATSPSQIAAANGKVVIADRYELRIYGSVTPAPQQPPARLRPSRR